MMDNALSQKIIAIVVERIERHAHGELQAHNDVADRVIRDAMAKHEQLAGLAVQGVRALRAKPQSRQIRYMGTYWNRRMAITDKDVAITRARVAGSASTIPTSRVEVMSWAGRPFNSKMNVTLLAEWLKERKAKADAKFYDEVALELDLIDVTKNGEWGNAEVILIGGASDGSLDRAKGLITHVRRPADHEIRRFHGADRIAVPWWPLAEDGRSTIAFYGEVWELDAHDRQDYVEVLGGAAALAEAIIAGLVAGGVIGGPVGAIAGAVVGALVGLITIFIALNDDDYWGAHQILLTGPYGRDSNDQQRITRYKDGDGYKYKLEFMRLLHEV